MIPNRIPLDTLLHMQVKEIVALSAQSLSQLQQDAEKNLRQAKQIVAWLNGALTVKYGEQAKDARAAAEKNFGVVRFVDDGVCITADLPKKVDWDQGELADLVERIKADGENPLEYIDIIYRVSERKFVSWPNHIRRVFEEARTVRAGIQSFELIASDNSNSSRTEELPGIGNFGLKKSDSANYDGVTQ